MLGIESLFLFLGLTVFAVGLIVGRRSAARSPRITAGVLVARQDEMSPPAPPAPSPERVEEIDQLIGEIASSPAPIPELVRRPSKGFLDTQPLWTVTERVRFARGSVAPPRMLDDLITPPHEASVIVEDELLIRWTYTHDRGGR